MKHPSAILWQKPEIVFEYAFRLVISTPDSNDSSVNVGPEPHRLSSQVLHDLSAHNKNLLGVLTPASN